MILTYKIKHHQDYSDKLLRARRIAEYVVAHKPSSAKFSSKNVKHFGLKSVISNQIIRKYGRNKKIKKVSRVNLIIPNQGIKNKEDNIIYIPSLKLNLEYYFPDNFE